LGIGPREGVLLGANLGRAIVHTQEPIQRTCDTAPRRGPLPKLLWADLLCYTLYYLQSCIYIYFFAVNCLLRFWVSKSIYKAQCTTNSKRSQCAELIAGFPKISII